MQKKTIAVLHVLTDGSFGGALSWLCALFSSADFNRFRYGVILPVGSEAEKRLAHFPIERFPLSLQKASVSLADLSNFSRAIRAFSPDIIQTHGAFGARLAGSFSAPHAFLLLTKHCVFESRRSRFPLLAHTSALFFRPFTHAAFATAECAKELLLREGFSASSVLTIHNGSPFKKAPNREEILSLRQKLGLCSFIIVFCGRLEKEKNPRFLLDVAAILSKKTKKFSILLIGDGKEKEIMIEDAAARNLENCFHFLGYQETPHRYLALADVQINCSIHSETSSLSLIEGFSLGVPAVVSSLKGNRETVKNGQNGLIYPKGNAHTCAELLLRLMDDKNLHKHLSLGAYRSYHKAFSSKCMTKKYEYFYRTLIFHS